MMSEGIPIALAAGGFVGLIVGFVAGWVFGRRT
jgi:hypothetical protein